MPCPGYTEIRLALGPGGASAALIGGGAARRGAHRHRGADRHGGAALVPEAWSCASPPPSTRAFPNISRVRTVAPGVFTYALLRRFHAPARGVMVATTSVRRRAGRARLRQSCGRGRAASIRDLSTRRCAPSEVGFPRPIFLYVGRVALEKNLPAFLGARSAGHPRSSSARGRQLRRTASGAFPTCISSAGANGALARILCLGRCLRVSEPHRHVRPRDARGACLGCCRSRPIRCRGRSM